MARHGHGHGKLDRAAMMAGQGMVCWMLRALVNVSMRRRAMV